jgi:hypothetical protein
LIVVGYESPNKEITSGGFSDLRQLILEFFELV